MYRQITSHTNLFALTVSCFLEEMQNTHLQSPTYLFQSPSNQCGFPSWLSVKNASFKWWHRYWILSSPSLDSVQTKFGSYFWVVWNKLAVIFSPKNNWIWGATWSKQNKSVNSSEAGFLIPKNIHTFQWELQNKLSTWCIFYTAVICHIALLLCCACGQWLTALNHHDEQAAPSGQVKQWPCILKCYCYEEQT